MLKLQISSGEPVHWGGSPQLGHPGEPDDLTAGCGCQPACTETARTQT